MEYLYISPCFDGISQEFTPAIPVACKWRWVCQPSFDLRVGGLNWFEDSKSVACWVFQTDCEIKGFETPSTLWWNGTAWADAGYPVYPNGMPLVDAGMDAKEWTDYKP